MMARRLLAIFYQFLTLFAVRDLLCEELIQSQQLHKPKTLSMLSFIPRTGKEPSDGSACMAALQVVTDEVNSRRDILADYSLTINTQDEGRSASLSLRNFFRYLDETDAAKKSRNDLFKSPIALGPSLGCQSIALPLKHYHFTEISEICTGQAILDKKAIIRNLYRVQTPVVNTVASMMMVAYRVGKWKQMASITNSLNPNEYLLAYAFLANAGRNGMQSLLHASVPEITPAVVDSFKQSGARVVGLYLAQPTLCLQFWCLAYQAGMRGSQYAFIANFYCYFAPDAPALVFPSGCNRRMLYEQLAITFWAGSYTSAVQSYGTTSLGYDLKWFEEKIGKALNHTIVADYDQRHLCHDTMMATVLALNSSEAALKSQLNMTLSDFEVAPDIVAKYVNESAAAMDFNGLRIGRVKYSERLELDFEDTWIGQWINGGMRLLYRVNRVKDDVESIFDLDAYRLIPTENAPVWLTKTGSPPKDLSDISKRTAIYPFNAMITILSFVGMGVILQIILPMREMARKHIDGSYAFPARLILSFGCFLLHLSAAFSAVGTIHFPQLTCRLLPIFTTMGLVIVNGSLFMRMASFSGIGRSKSNHKLDLHSIRVTTNNSKRTARSSARKSRLSQMTTDHSRGPISHISDRTHSPVSRVASDAISSNSRDITTPNPKQIRETFISGVAVSSLVGVVILLVWLAGIDPMAVKNHTTPLAFDESADMYFTLTVNYCSSKYLSYFVAAVGAINIFLLLGACFLAYHIRKYTLPKDLVRESLAYRLATLNATTIYIAFLLIIFIVPTTDTNFAQLIVFAVGHLLFATSTVVIISVPSWLG